jgi:hypothetical protein
MATILSYRWLPLRCCLIALVCWSDITVVHTFSTGPGGCLGGNQSVSDTHLKDGYQTGSLSDFRIKVFINNNLIINPDEIIELTPNADNPVRVTAVNEQYRGILIRLAGTAGQTILDSTMTVRSQNVQITPMCVLPSVIGIGHFDASSKDRVAAKIDTNGLAGNFVMDITVVFWNNDTSSLWAHSGYTLSVGPATPVVPVTPPVTPPVAPPVAPPVTAPVTPPVTPPIRPPITPPVTPPIAPPVTQPVIPPVIQPVPPPVVPVAPVVTPVAPVSVAPVIPITSAAPVLPITPIRAPSSRTDTAPSLKNPTETVPETRSSVYSATSSSSSSTLGAAAVPENATSTTTDDSTTKSATITSTTTSTSESTGTTTTKTRTHNNLSKYLRSFFG